MRLTQCVLEDAGEEEGKGRDKDAGVRSASDRRNGEGLGSQNAVRNLFAPVRVSVTRETRTRGAGQDEEERRPACTVGRM